MQLKKSWTETIYIKNRYNENCLGNPIKLMNSFTHDT